MTVRWCPPFGIDAHNKETAAVAARNDLAKKNMELEQSRRKSSKKNKELEQSPGPARGSAGTDLS